MINFTFKDKILTSDKLHFKVRGWRFGQYTIAFTNGCFDLLHIGHIQYLSDARKPGRKLIVGLNSDSSVQRLKGDTRPVNSQADRAIMLAALHCVDAVVIFEEDTAIPLLELLTPDVYIKGGDYAPQSLPEYKTVIGYGGTVEILPFVAGYSTTHLIQKLK